MAAVSGVRGGAGVWGWLAGVFLALAVVLVVQWLVGWAEVGRAWLQIPPSALAAAMLLMTVSYLLRAARLARLAGVAGVVATAWQWVRISVLHTCAVNVLPMRAGEGALPWMLKRHGDLSLPRGLGLVVALRLQDLVVMAALGLVVVVTLWAGLMAGALAALPVLLLGRWVVRTWPGWLLRWLDRGPVWVARLAWPLRLLAARPPGVYWLGVAAWTVKWLAMALIIHAATAVAPVRAAIAIAAAEVAAVLPVQGIAGAGTFEAAVTGALTLTGLDAAQALQLAVILHLFILGMSLLLAALVAPLGKRRG